MSAQGDRPWMVFHAPYPLDPDPTSASRLRPLRMREAFAQIGYRVFDLSGSVSRRRRAFAALRARVAAGDRPAFLYSENSTQPNVLATSVRTGVAPLLDYRIMRAMRHAGVPVGVFYRDAYWRFAFGRASGLRGSIVPALQKADLVGYRRNGVNFFVPSRPMADVLGLDDDVCSPLPPAGQADCSEPLPPVDGTLHLVYVGGLGGHYDLDVFFSALVAIPCAQLELVTRKPLWETAVAANPELSAEQIRVSHLAANELAPVYRRASVGVLTARPSEYWSFAVPVKLFEYLSYGRPVIATRGTETGRIVEANGAGWVVDYDRDAIASLLAHLQEAPEEIAERAAAARAAARVNTWADRARDAARTLSPQSLEALL
ncbi:glycosyltransferase [Actinomyces sp. 565]|uniref:glycosyltransferase n=1 Tax=Actinomyces sp. 565 TaxID=2057794 RepID=UPI001EF0F57F|nr:glycosyltransferase [Actinomyces sp. 565]